MLVAVLYRRSSALFQCFIEKPCFVIAFKERVSNCTADIVLTYIFKTKHIVLVFRPFFKSKLF